MKHAILHVGTNDVETRRAAANIADNIVAAAVKLLDKSGAKTSTTSALRSITIRIRIRTRTFLSSIITVYIL